MNKKMLAMIFVITTPFIAEAIAFKNLFRKRSYLPKFKNNNVLFTVRNYSSAEHKLKALLGGCNNIYFQDKQSGEIAHLWWGPAASSRSFLQPNIGRLEEGTNDYKRVAGLFSYTNKAFEVPGSLHLNERELLHEVSLNPEKFFKDGLPDVH